MSELEKSGSAPGEGAPAGGNGSPAGGIPPKMGFGAKLINIFVEPSAVFKNIYYYNDWLTPLIIIGVVTIVSSLLMAGYSADAQSQFRELMGAPKQPAVETATRITQYVTAFLSPAGILVRWLISAAIIFVLGTFLLDNIDFKKLYSIVAWCSMPTLFTTLINGIYRMNQTPLVSSYDDYMDAMTPWSLSPSLFIHDAGMWGMLLSGFDVFTLWSWYLLALGLAYGLRNRIGKAWTVVIVTILIGLAIGAGILYLSTSVLRPKGM